MEPVQIDKKKTLIISDGGNQLSEIDHTYPAFLASCNRSFDGILAHIRFTKDRYIVCYRHRSLSKLLHKKIHISTHNYDYLSSLDLGRPFSKITTLCDLISLCLSYKKKIYLKLCPPVGKLELAQIKDTINDVTDKVVLISNDERHLKYFRKTFSNLSLILELPIYNEYYEKMCLSNHFDCLLDFENITPLIIEKAHHLGIKIGIKRIDNPIDASMMIENNLDFFFTEELV